MPLRIQLRAVEQPGLELHGLLSLLLWLYLWLNLVSLAVLLLLFQGLSHRVSDRCQRDQSVLELRDPWLEILWQGI